MSDVLLHDPADNTPIRNAAIEAAVTGYEFNGGTVPAFNIALTPPTVAGQQYTFAGTVDSISSGSITGLLFGGGSGASHNSAGAFSETITAGSSGQTIFQLRGANGTVAHVSNVSLTPVP